MTTDDRAAASLYDVRVRGPRRRSVSMQVADLLRHRILTGELLSGAALVHEEVASQLGVSTMPVREALLRLSHEGFVVAQPNRSFRVAETARSDIDDLYWIYGVIAAELADRACRRNGAELATVLDGLNAAWVELDEDDTEEFERINHEIHRAINLSAESPKLSFVLGQVTRFIPERFYTLLPSWKAMSFEDHRALAESFRAGRADAAAEAMTRHVLDASEVLAAYFTDSGYWAPVTSGPLPGRRSKI